MPLRPLPEMFAHALKGKYALGYFESWNLESLQGVIDAAEQTRSPIIVGFNGEFLTDPDRKTRENIAWYGALGRSAAESAAVPCGLIFNECPFEEHVRQAVRAGFNLVMLASHEHTYAEYIRSVTSLVSEAHEGGAAVEAEVGELPVGSTGSVNSEHSSLTDPEMAERFVKTTRIDLLSVSVGNIHILVKGQHELDLDRLESIHRRVDIPLGLHGGTGIAEDSLRLAIRQGVVKVAYGTYLKQRYLAAVSKAIGQDSPETATNPHKLFGMGGSEDVLVAGRLAVRDAVLERIDLLGCCGKAL
jgi:ketose-bisphosphate aldolase